MLLNISPRFIEIIASDEAIEMIPSGWLSLDGSKALEQESMLLLKSIQICWSTKQANDMM
tara:strand:+ start:394 stop:573 length:180 start_codon:yes stop_codon:yes gene_type:complete